MSDALAYQITETTPRIPRRRGRLRALPGRAARWLGRRRGALLALAALALLGLRHPADARQRDAAEGEARTVASAAEVAKTQLQLEIQREKSRADRAEAALEHALKTVARDAELQESGSEALSRRLADATAAYFNRIYHEGERLSDDRQALVLTQQARLAALYGRSRPAAGYYRLAIKLYEVLVAREPAGSPHRPRLAECRAERGEVLAADGQLAEAEGEFRAALKIWEDAKTDEACVARCQAGLGRVLHAAGDNASAERAYRAAVEWLGQSILRTTDPSDAWREVARTGERMGDLCRDTQRGAKAEEWYAYAVSSLANVPEGRRLASDRRLAGRCHRERARALVRAGRHADSLPDWDRAVERCDPAERDEWNARLRGRLTALTLAGRHVEAIAKTRDVSFPVQKDGEDAMLLPARVFSRAVPADDAEADQRAREAVRQLEWARDRGHFADLRRVLALRRDADFDPLRGRREFEAFLATVEPERLPAPAARP